MTNKTVHFLFKLLILLIIIKCSIINSYAQNVAKIGVIITNQDITGILVNSPAHIAGLKIGDKIINIDDKLVHGLSEKEIMNKISGQEGSIVQITVQRNTQLYNYKIARKDISTLQKYIPSWNEFCPTSFLDVNFVEENDYKQWNYCQKNDRKSKIIREITFFPALFCGFQEGWEKSKNRYSNESNAYWIARRKLFKKEIELCLANPENQLACFVKVRDIENTKNNNLSQEQLLRGQMILNQLNNNLIQMNLNEMNMNLNNINSNLFFINNNLLRF